MKLKISKIVKLAVHSFAAILSIIYAQNSSYTNISNILYFIAFVNIAMIIIITILISGDSNENN